MKKTYTQSADEVLRDLGVGAEGLTTAQAQERLAKYGPNKLKEAEKPTLIQRFIEQLKDPMLIILMVAAAVSALTGILSGKPEWADVIIIMTVVLLNAILGVIQESKAEAAIEALQTMTAATCKVLRDGKMVILHSDELVPGDVVLLEAGDAVPADGRIIENASLKIEEAALTGESVPVNKMLEALGVTEGQDDVPLGDRKNMCYMGSTVVYGRGKAVITTTGMETEMGKIAGALAATEQEETPLQRKLDELGTLLSKLVLGICVFIFAFNLFTARNELSIPGHTLSVILETFMVAVSLAVAAIPEGLATVVTVVLSIGVTKMSQRNAVIRRLTAVETLGCTQVICSDKTGTLTQNKMTVVDHIGETNLVATAMALCSDANLNDENQAEGEPTECALVNFAYSVGLKKQDMEKATPRVDEAPFDSGRKMMSTIHDLGGKFVQYTKGGPDVVLGVFCSTLMGFTLLNPVHLLFINLVTDCFPALALGMEEAEPDIMNRPPRDSKEGIFAGGMFFDIAYQGVLVTAITIAAYIIGHCIEVGYFEMPQGVSPDGMTMAFLTMSMCEIFHSFNLRSQRKSVFSLKGQNMVLWAAMIGSLVLTTLLLEVPFLAAAFGFEMISWTEYAISIGLAFLVIPIVEIVKFFQRKAAK